jgi:hypothetical protein
MVAPSIEQEDEWQYLHDLITQTMDRFGRKDAVGKGDYWLLDENWGWYRHQLEFQSLSLFRPEIVRLLQGLLSDFPEWDMTLRVDVPNMREKWPVMGLVVAYDGILDELQRQYLPKEFHNLVY